MLALRRSVPVRSSGGELNIALGDEFGETVSIFLGYGLLTSAQSARTLLRNWELEAGIVWWSGIGN